MYNIEKCPTVIEVPFEYSKKTSYYAIDIKGGYMIDRLALSTILSFCEDIPEYVERVSYWQPTQHGWECAWGISADEFVKRHKLIEIK